MLNIDIAAKKKDKVGRRVGNIQHNDEGVAIFERVAS